mmetsp:Transcript_59534/g.112256  ORF Transcript_59534/g.112256 Transcript_59534/m.112256 type:complete len:204 (+) Transcript_59534:1358-1969(+)
MTSRQAASSAVGVSALTSPLMRTPSNCNCSTFESVPVVAGLDSDTQFCRRRRQAAAACRLGCAAASNGTTLGKSETGTCNNNLAAAAKTSSMKTLAIGRLVISLGSPGLLSLSFSSPSYLSDLATVSVSTIACSTKAQLLSGQSFASASAAINFKPPGGALHLVLSLDPLKISKPNRCIRVTTLLLEEISGVAALSAGHKDAV